MQEHETFKVRFVCGHADKVSVKIGSFPAVQYIVARLASDTSANVR